MIMYNKNRKYMYYEDKFGVMLCYIDSQQPASEDVVFITIIAERKRNEDGTYSDWDVSQRDKQLAVELRKVFKKEFKNGISRNREKLPLFF